MASELQTYQGHLDDARDAVQTVYNALKIANTTLTVVSGVVGALKQIDTNADRLEKVANGLQTVMKLVGKIGPLKGLTKPLGELLQAVENRAKEVEASAEKLDSKFKPLADAITVQKAIINLQLVTLSESLDQIDSIKGLNISIVTTAKTDAEGRALLAQLGMPFRQTAPAQGAAA